MFKKELADVAKQTAIFIPVVVLLPAVFLALHLVGRRMSYIAVLLPVYQIGLLFWALFLGSSLLMQERDQRAVEYILSMPYSRLQMIGYKILPRVMILSVLSFLFWLLYRMNGSMYAAIGIEPFIITLAFFFIISICLAPIVENFLVLTLVTMFSAAACWTIVLTIIWLIHHSPNQGATLMAHFKGVFTLSWLYTEKWLGPLLWIDALILLVPFLLAFITTVRKFDTRPGARHNRRFASFFIPAALIAVAATYIHSDAVIPLGPQYFQLTRDHKLIEFRDSMCTIYEENRTLKICPKDGLDDEEK